MIDWMSWFMGFMSGWFWSLFVIVLLPRIKFGASSANIKK